MSFIVVSFKKCFGTLHQPIATNFPIAGYLFGKKLIETSNVDDFYKKILTWTGLLFFPLITVMYELHIDCGAIDGFFGMEYFHMDYFGNLMTLEIILLWVSFWHFASENLPVIMKNTLIRWSKHINTFYVVQWVLIGWGNIAFGYFCHDFPVVLLLFVYTLAGSDFFSHMIIKTLSARRTAKCTA